VSRVIGSFMGIPEEDDAVWARLMNSALGASDPDLNPYGPEGTVERDVPEIFERCRTLIAERRERPTDDLTSVLVHAEVEGSKLEEHESGMGFFLLVAAGNDSTKATYCSAMRALMEDAEQKQLLLEDPSLIPDAVEEALRMFPAFAHFRRTAMCDTELHGQKIKEGEKVVMWYVSSNRDESRYEDPDRFDLRRKAEHQAFGAGEAPARWSTPSESYAAAARARISEAASGSCSRSRRPSSRSLRATSRRRPSCSHAARASASASPASGCSATIPRASSAEARA